MTAKFKGELFERSGRADLYVSSEQQDMHFSSGATRAAGLYYSKTADVRRFFSIICGPFLAERHRGQRGQRNGPIQHIASRPGDHDLRLVDSCACDLATFSLDAKHF